MSFLGRFEGRTGKSSAPLEATVLDVVRHQLRLRL
jgi:hypothetical protein